MDFELLECVVLVHDIPAHGLKTSDLGAVVEVYPKGGLEVEFVTCSGGHRGWSPSTSTTSEEWMHTTFLQPDTWQKHNNSRRIPPLCILFFSP